MNLFHGSRFRQTELMPGFQRSGEMVRWDQTESNLWLYATTNQDEAVRQGLFAIFANAFDVKRCSSAPGQLVIELYPHQEAEKTALYAQLAAFGMAAWLRQQALFLYQLHAEEGGVWEKNDNAHNQLDNEWKTQATVKPVSVDVIDIEAWLAKRNLKIELVCPKQKPVWLTWV